ncbi:MAG: chemotaxis protein CheW [Bdellovibrio sp. CG12_big_fil_rev_8_21_14_0_65_39_13]|nr:MAG: chemotaxis protein CheW [Bdellovibrio sp. CG22_combo_CG10-13_8_21_14_all_39_27]PIQ61075.1 MAG: chemotaxis protein CheW [Bdellovibrio sp. CG12_big_fil_rev_8_21_14_0_65_39_13]PIR36843.1 MAG: chemotaxis protein CheW [Bdellovibrio sp. CG11_big_fil_rev_8_21_14_0_20_39_38]
MDQKLNEDNLGSMLEKEEVQLCGFKIGNGHYAVPVLDVQEVIRPQKLTPIPLAPDYIDGLINLRGQIVTAINMRKLFKLEDTPKETYMNIIVRSDDNLYSLVVDEILDVMEVPTKSFENTPDTLDLHIRGFISGVFKLKKQLLVLLNLEKIINIE